MPVKLAPKGAKFEHQAEIVLNSLSKKSSWFRVITRWFENLRIKSVKLAPLGAKFQYEAETG